MVSQISQETRFSRRLLRAEFLFWGGILITLAWGFFYITRTRVIVNLDKEQYYHYEFVRIKVNFRDRFFAKRLKDAGKLLSFTVTQAGETTPVVGIGNIQDFPLSPANDRLWQSDWPCPWNLPAGTYQVNLIFPEGFSLPPSRIESHHFRVTYRKPTELPFPLRVLTFENIAPLRGMVLPLPSGDKGNWRGIFDWVSFTNCNAFWHLGGCTAYYDRSLPRNFPWVADNLSLFREVGKEAHRRGYAYGVWIIAYLTFGNSELRPTHYRYAWDYREKQGLFETRSISIGDENRLKDILNLVAYLNQIPEIDYVGLDYIRNALGGYEMVDEFVREMAVIVPKGWKQWKLDDRMRWLAREKISRENEQLIDQWQWWRAQRVANIVTQVRRQLVPEKRLWVFTLSWDKGWQHGQDPVMMNDAGADVDAVMLYEADQEQFAELINDWHNYVRRDQVNLVVGDVFDWVLHQKTLNPAGPEEFKKRMEMAIEKICNDGISKGVFLHDLGRALWGRKGPYSSLEWLLAGGAVNSFFQQKWYRSPLDVRLAVPENSRAGQQTFALIEIFNRQKQRAYLGELTVFSSPDIELGDWGKKEFVLQPQEQCRLSCPFTVLRTTEERGGTHFLAVRSQARVEQGKSPEVSFLSMNYFGGSSEKVVLPDKKDFNNEGTLPAGVSGKPPGGLWKDVNDGRPNNQQPQVANPDSQ